MSETILAFQSQLSGVMETVFKAAMYEIVKLVEESFLEEVSRSREQVESLKKRLQWSESRRRDREGDGRSRCAECGRAGASRDQTDERLPGAEGDSYLGATDEHGLKRERSQEGKWNSCPREAANTPPVQETEEEAIPITSTDPQVIPVIDCREDPPLKEEECEQDCEIELAVSQEADEANSFNLQMRCCNQIYPHGNAFVCSVTGGDEADSHLHPMRHREQTCGSSMKHDSQPSSAHLAEHQRSRQDVGETSQLYIPHPGSEGTTKRFSEAPLCSAEGQMHSTVVQFKTVSSKDGCCPEDTLAQMNAQPVADSLPPSRINNVECELESFVAIKKEGGMDPECTTRVGYVQREQNRHDKPRPNAQYDTSPNSTSTLDLTGIPGVCSRLEHSSMQTQERQRVHLRKRLQVIRRHNIEASDMDSPVEGGSLSYEKYFIMQKNADVQHKVCTVDKQFSSVHIEDSVTHGVLNVKAQLKTPHSCTQCGKSFSHSCHLKAHLQTHTGERPFICTLCGRSFTKLSNLKAHRRVHTGERPYICTDCGKRFTQKCNLKRHQRIHTERLFVCK